MFNSIIIREFVRDDAESVLLLCQQSKERVAGFKIIYAVVAEEDDNIIGFSAISENLMIEPLATCDKLGQLKAVWVKIALLKNIQSVLSRYNINKVMFATGDEQLVKFLSRRFDISLYTKESLYTVNVN